MRGIAVIESTWRESARPVRLFFLNAYVVVPLFLLLWHPRQWTLVAFVLTVIFLVVSERFGYTPPVAMLALRSRITGPLVKRRKALFDKWLDN